MRYLKKTFTGRGGEIIFVSSVIMIMYLIGMFMNWMSVNLNTDSGLEDVGIFGTMFALMALVIMSFVGFVFFCQNFNLKVGMNLTRKGFIIEELLYYILITLFWGAFIWVLKQLENVWYNGPVSDVLGEWYLVILLVMFLFGLFMRFFGGAILLRYPGYGWMFFVVVYIISMSCIDFIHKIVVWEYVIFILAMVWIIGMITAIRIVKNLAVK